MYIKVGCPFCAAAEDLFVKKGVKYKTVDYYNLSPDELAKVSEKTDNWSTAPMFLLIRSLLVGMMIWLSWMRKVNWISCWRMKYEE